MGMGWASGALNGVNGFFRGVHDNYDPAIHWMHDSWHQIGGNKIPDQPGLHSIVSGAEGKPANYAAGILGAIYGGAAALGSGSGGAAGSAGGGSAVPVTEAGFAAGSTPTGAGWTAGTGGGTFGAGTGSGLQGTNFAQLLSKGLNSYGQGSQGQSQGANYSPEAVPDSYTQQPASAPSGAYSPLAPNPYKLPNVPQGMAYNDPNNPSFPTNSMNPYALNTPTQNPFNSGLYAMGATNA